MGLRLRGFRVMGVLGFQCFGVFWDFGVFGGYGQGVRLRGQWVKVKGLSLRVQGIGVKGLRDWC